MKGTPLRSEHTGRWQIDYLCRVGRHMHWQRFSEPAYLSASSSAAGLAVQLPYQRVQAAVQNKMHASPLVQPTNCMRNPCSSLVPHNRPHPIEPSNIYRVSFCAYKPSCVTVHMCYSTAQHHLVRRHAAIFISTRASVRTAYATAHLNQLRVPFFSGSGEACYDSTALRTPSGVAKVATLHTQNHTSIRRKPSVPHGMGRRDSNSPASASPRPARSFRTPPSPPQTAPRRPPPPAPCTRWLTGCGTLPRLQAGSDRNKKKRMR